MWRNSKNSPPTEAVGFTAQHSISVRGVDELERLREEKRIRNKFMMMHWKQRHCRSHPYPVCFRP
ncbi:PREDICTED: transcription elongation factor A protein-like 8-like [Chrysochloris asiatica]|uniref:Transcription elongation factor A protein-like 8-like n=1 Tax=Chrysochloris asiatica TaxID=185453 RepID=A0A9B0WUU9_CHRAS|nr:PREDICTED: transcription elongation factor A protein-like 8-like [Chrysochloris asiatica]